MKDDVKTFMEGCIKSGEAAKLGNSKVINKQYEINRSIAAALKQENRLSELFELLDHENPSVLFSAAYYALQVDPKKVEAALERNSSVWGEIWLQRWRKCKIKFE